MEKTGTQNTNETTHEEAYCSYCERLLKRIDRRAGTAGTIAGGVITSIRPISECPWFDEFYTHIMSGTIAGGAAW